MMNVKERNVACEAARDASRLDEIHGLLAGLVDYAHHTAERLDKLNLRLIGPGPETTGDAGPAPNPVGKLGELRRTVNDLSHMLDRIAAASHVLSDTL